MKYEIPNAEAGRIIVAIAAIATFIGMIIIF